MFSTLTLSIIVPIYKSYDNLLNNYDSLISYISKLGLKDYEVLFIDDESPDESYNYLKSKSDKNIKILRHSKNLGLGGVLQSGFMNSLYQKVIYLDMDLSYGLTNISKMLEMSLDNHKVIIASKYKSQKNQIPKLRVFYKRVFDIVINLLSNINISDIGSGLVLFPKEKLASMNLQTKGFAVHYEIFLLLRKSNSQIVEIDIDYCYSPGTPSLRKHFTATIKEVITTYIRNI